jgi:hypothetical protein
MSDIKARLIEEIAEVEWNDLIPHAQRDAAIVVDKSLSLINVGVAIANDDAASVQQWISQQLIHKPSTDELSAWNNEPDKKFNTLIVQPFVLVSAI